MQDLLARPLRDLRLSVTDRCNFRCTYCMPREVFGRDFTFLPRTELLSFEEIVRLGRIMVGLGVEKIRITGGEPLLRRGLESLVSKLAVLDGLKDLALTTNGSVLTLGKAQALREAGLRRISISLDSLDDETFRRMNDVAFPVARVLAAVDAALEAGLAPVKIDMVVKRGLNDLGVVTMARRFRGTGCVLRFIEFMDVGNHNEWNREAVVSGAEILRRVQEVFALEPLPPNYPGEVARRFRYSDGQGEIGIITSVTRPFCGGCTRLRMSADGQLYTCLFGQKGVDVRGPLRAGCTDAEIESLLRRTWQGRSDRYSELRQVEGALPDKVEMSRIGG